MNTPEIRNCFTNIPTASKAHLDRLLSGPCKVVVASHKNPDGDAVGSALGLAKVLKNQGHEVKVLLPDSMPAFLNWLPGSDEVMIFEYHPEKIKKMVRQADLLFVVDLSDPDRMGDLQLILDGFEGLSVQLDHHPGEGGFTGISCIDVSCGSTSELIYDFIEYAGIIANLDSDAATCLLTGIITDTLGFKVASSYPGIFKVVMRLMEAGANKDLIFDQVYNQYSENRLRLMGFSLAHRMKVFMDQGAACIYLTNKDMEDFQHRKGDTEGFVNLPLSIKGIHLSVLFTEQEDHIKLSLRSTGQLSVNDISKAHFNGGGHHNAAGGRFYGSMSEALAYYEELVKNIS